MGLTKLATVDAFVVRDFDETIPAIGIVRSANKILQSGARDLARSATYQCALINMRCQGSSAGINAPVEARDDAIASFVAELLPSAVDGQLMLDPGKGVGEGMLDELVALDSRHHAHRRVVDGVPNRHHLVALSAVVGAETVRPLDDARVAIENFESGGPSIARLVDERGGQVVALSTAAGSATREEGFEIAELLQAFETHGADFVAALAGDKVEPSARIAGADADVLFIGSKMGLLSHTSAPYVKASVIAPTGPIPYTTKGALMLQARDITVLPDFATTAGALLAAMPPGADDQASIEADVESLSATLCAQLLAGEHSPILEACHMAESFLRTWRPELPFGRPFAA